MSEDKNMESLAKELMSKRENDVSPDKTLELFGKRMAECNVASETEIGSYIISLLELVNKFNVTIIPLKDTDIIALSAYMAGIQFQYTAEMEVAPVRYERVLIYQLLRSISNKHFNEVEGLKVRPSAAEPSRVMNSVMYNESQLFAYNYTKKSMKMMLLSPKFERTLTFNNENIFGWAVQTILNSLALDILSAKEKQAQYSEFIKNIYGNKLMVFTISELVSRLLGGIMFKNMFGGESAKISHLDLFEAICSIEKLLTNTVNCNVCIEGTVIEGYINYVKNLTSNLKEMNLDCNKFAYVPRVNTMEGKALRNDIKELRKLIYEVKKSKEVTEVKEVVSDSAEVEMEEDSIAYKDELKASNLIDIKDKFKLIEGHKILIITGITLGESLNDYCTIIDATKFKGKSIDGSYEYVVKITKGIDHAIGYDINSEVKKIDAKLITTSRTNTHLILDDIIAQM